LPKSLANGFPGVGYMTVAFSYRRRFFSFSQPIEITVAKSYEQQRFTWYFSATVPHKQPIITVAKSCDGNGLFGSFRQRFPNSNEI
jgi:hypothetical protein